MAAKNARIEDLRIEKWIYGGEGLAHHDGSTVFVPFVLPEEIVAVVPVERKKKFVRARLERVIEPSAARAAPRCRHFTICGGCDYQHATYEKQIEYKVQILRESLWRLGGMEWPGQILVHAGQPWEYRNRAQWKIRPLAEAPAVASNESPFGIGYFRPNSSALCAVEDCRILSPLLLKTLLALREALAKGALPRGLREVEAFANAGDSELLLTATFAPFPSRSAEVADRFHTAAPEILSLLFNDATRDRMELFGPGFLEYETRGGTLRAGHLSFFQVNRFLVDELAEVVAAGAAAGELALDLFAGVGLFTLPLARRFQRVIAVEANPAATRDLENNARASDTVEIRNVEVETFLEKFKEAPNLVVLDPPRAGLTPRATAQLARLAPEMILYVSCEPPTLARDLKVLCEAYEISHVHLFDLFPQTFHLETVVRLRRRK
jgi:23S rRNA (uracil1939-C5)-methyltransferase